MKTWDKRSGTDVSNEILEDIAFIYLNYNYCWGINTGNNDVFVK
jgi:hypothetical protein